MPLLHCKKCHHEWESSNVKATCDWCGGKSYILEDETAFERFIKNDLRRIVDAWKHIGDDFKDQIEIEKEYSKMVPEKDV